MDISVIYPYVFTIGTGLTAYQFKAMWAMQDTIRKLSDTAITESDVRQLIADNLSALRVTDDANKDRIDKLENRLNRIDDKLDRILALVGTNHNNK